MSCRVPFKFCANCNTKHGRLARICTSCGGKAVWIKPTAELIEADRARRERLESLLQHFIATGEL
jgi:hypothetical protein